jgi:hypothetical protein
VGELSWRPSAPQELLLKACLLADGPAATALAAWLAQPQAQRRDTASRRLLPLLWLRWQASGALPAAEQAAGKQQMLLTWGQNQRRLGQARALASAFAQADIPLLLVKGLPLAMQVYSSLAARPMGDLDLVVPYPRAEAAAALLVERGWRPAPTPLKGAEDPATCKRHPWLCQPRPLAALDPVYRQVRSGHAFRHADGSELDLHWFVFHEQCTPGIDDDLWAHAQPLNGPLLAPAAADHLLLLLAHGCRWDLQPPIRWVADAVLLLRNGSLDWDRFLAVAQQRRLAAVAEPLLTYLVETFAIAVPAAVPPALARLARRRPLGSALARQGAGRPDLFGAAQNMTYLFQRWQWLRGATPAVEQAWRVGGFDHFLCHVMGIPGRRALLRYALGERQRRSIKGQL